MDDRIREGIEACRPASDDLSAQDLADVARALADDAEAREWFERVGQWDTAIGEAVERVSVPEGLAERILARLQSAAPAEAEPTDAVPSDAVPSDAVPPLLEGAVAAATTAASPSGDVQVAQGRKAWSRRDWMGATVSVVAAAVLVVLVGVWLAQPSELSLEELADAWHERLEADAWQPVSDKLPHGFDIPDVVRATPTRWQQIDRFSTTPVVAYELEHATAGKAMLYVAQMSRPDLSTAPPSEPQHSTGGKTIAYWRSGKNVCLLVVPSQQRYPAFVQPPNAPLAHFERAAPAWRRAA